MKKWIFIILIILLIGIPLTIHLSRRTEGKETVREEGVPVTVTVAGIDDIAKKMSFSSQVEGIEQTPVYPDLPGDFMKFLVEDGQYVRKGQPLAYIEQDIPGVQREPIMVKSPISGIISLNSFDKGQLVRPQDPMTGSEPLGHVARVDRLKVKFSVPEKYRLKKGLPIEVEIPSLSGRFSGEITKASSFYDPSTRSQSVIGIFPNLERRIIPGMFARVWVEVERKENIIAIPVDAVIGLIDKHVFKVKNGRAIQKPVKVGISNESRISIEEGVEEGDTVIVEGQLIVNDGSRVEIKEIK